MYTAYVITDESQKKLEEKFPPKYSKFIGHHVTVDFGVSKDAVIPEEANLKILGRRDSADGIEALVLSVNGETQRPDGGIYHITWSLEPDKYSPKDSNALLKEAYFKYKMALSILIEGEPCLLK